MNVSYKHYKDFPESVRALHRRGGQFQKAAEAVQAMIGRISGGDENPMHGLKTTNHGESRIRKCVKYDLSGFCRLVTIQDNGIVLLCFAGNHDECDAWLGRNAGMTITKNASDQISYVYAATVGGSPDEAPRGPSALTQKKLFEYLPQELVDRFLDNCSRSVCRSLEQLESINSEDDIRDVVSSISDRELAQAIFDSFSLLRQDKVPDAVERIRYYLGDIRPAALLTKEEVEALSDSEKISSISSDDPRYEQVFSHFVKNASYMSWMLFLHPDQAEVVRKDFTGAAKVTGVSGSGKTCIVVRRAIRLAETYPEEKMLVITLNRQLSKLISQMVDSAAHADIRSRIEVQPLFRICQDYLSQFEPANGKLYDDVTWKSREHIDEVWREFYRCELNNHDAKILLPLHDSLVSRGVNAEQYIREEFDWIRSAFSRSDRRRYLDIERQGRGYPLDKRYRHLLLDGLSFWEKKMAHVGITDYVGISSALVNHLEKIEPKYRCVLVDESQDFGTMDLRIIRRLVSKSMNDIFLCGDAAQQISTRHRSFREAGIDVPSLNCLTVNKNYRNSREILSLAYGVLYENLAEEMLNLPDFDVLEPEYANFSGSAPLCLRGDSLEHEIAAAVEFARQEVSGESGRVACVSFCGFSLHQVRSFGCQAGFTVLDGETPIEAGNVYFSDLEHTKGFEFDTVIIVNCNHGVVPDESKPAKEQYRDLSRLYVAMTRAKNQLVLSWSSRMSPYLEKQVDKTLEDSWSTYLGAEMVASIGVPPSLDDIRSGDSLADPARSLLDLSGPEFLYSEYALGIDQSLIEKIRTLVPGVGLRRSGIPVQWVSIGGARSDGETHVRSRALFGQNDWLQFRSLVDGLAARR